MATSRDASSPARWDLAHPGGGSTNPAGSSASFTPPVDSVIVVCVTCDTLSGTTPTLSVSNTGFTVDSWVTHVERGDSEGTGGYAAIASAVVTASAAGTVSVTVNNIGVSRISVTSGYAWADVWTGADTSAGRMDKTGEGSSTSQDITPTVFTLDNAARAIGVAEDWNAAAAPTSSDEEDAIQGTYVTGIRAYKASDSAAGAVTINFNGTGAARDWNWCAVGLKAAGSGPAYVPRSMLLGVG